MAPTEDAISMIKQALEPYIKRRDEVAYIRRTLALYLQDSIEGPELESPIPLVDESSRVTIPPDLRGLRRQYLEALDANLKATAAFQEVRSQIKAIPAAQTSPPAYKMDAINDQLLLIKLKQREERLSVITRYLDDLSEKPAAQPEFLDLADIFQDSPPLPEMPEAVIASAAAEKHGGSGGNDGCGTNDRLAEMDRQILKTKLLLKREEQLLETARNLSPVNPERVAEARKRYALNATRNELISWIEAELSKAQGDSIIPNRRRSSGFGYETVSTEQVDSLMLEVKERYAEYNAHRQALLDAIGKIPTLENAPVLHQSPSAAETCTPTSPPVAHLVTPYLNKLFALSREQTGIIAHKDHIQTALATQNSETRQMLDHLAEESQLLPAYPMDANSRGVNEEDAMDASARVAEWAYAGEAAKIASLEIVAERLETGQMALEASQVVLEDIKKVLEPSEDTCDKDAKDDSGGDDAWADGGKAGRSKTNATTGDAWSRIHGNLGLIGQDM